MAEKLSYVYTFEKIAATARSFKACVRNRDWDEATAILIKIENEYGENAMNAFHVKHIGDMIEQEGFSFDEED